MKIADTSGQDVMIEPTTSRKKRYVFIGAIVMIILIGFFVTPTLARWSSAGHSVSLERIRIAKVTRGDFVRDVSVQGRIVAAVSPTLYATAPGTVTFHVQAGESVQKADVLGEVDSPELTNRLAQESATLESMKIERERQEIQSKKQKLENQRLVDQTKITLKASDREQRRSQLAFERNAISPIDYEKSRDDLDSAKLAYKHAVEDASLNQESLEFEMKTKRLEIQRQQLLVDDLRRQVDELKIRSPVAGIVGQLVVEQKTAVAKNQAIITVVDLSQFEVEVAVPESYADDLGLGMAAEIRISNEIHDAILVSISPEIQNNQVMGRVRFEKEPPMGLRQNQRMTTRILLERKEDVLMVQRGQFLDSSAGRFAYLVDGDIAEKTDIKTGARSLSHVEILDGLDVNQEIIISNTESFQDSDTVLINR